jgi:phage tail protein X
MAAAQFITHITADGERWDVLAWKYYGNAALYSPIIMANPQIPIESVFEAGVRIAIPIMQVNPAQKNDLPPWKRAC